MDILKQALGLGGNILDDLKKRFTPVVSNVEHAVGPAVQNFLKVPTYQQIKQNPQVVMPRFEMPQPVRQKITDFGNLLSSFHAPDVTPPADQPGWQKNVENFFMPKGQLDLSKLQIEPIVQSAGNTIARIGQGKFLQGTLGNKAEDIINAASVLPYAGYLKATRPELEGAVSILKTTNWFTKEDRNLIGRFAEMVDKAGTNANRKNMGQVGNDVEVLAKHLFGNQSGGWTNKELRDAFDYVMERVGQGKRSPQGMLSIRDMSKGLSKDKGATPLFKQAELPAGTQVDVLNGMQSGKERKFIQTVREAPSTAEEVSKEVKGFYEPITNRDTVKKAQFVIDTEGWDVAKQKALTGELNAENNAIGMELMRRAQSAGRFDEATELAQQMAVRATQAGQATQAWSIWARMTPEGMLKFAAGQIDKAKEEMGFATKFVRDVLGKKAPELTSEDSAFITNYMKKANAAQTEEEKAKYVSQVYELIGKKIPWGVSDILDEYRYNNMLSNPLTHLRNAIGNLQQAFVVRPATLVAQGKPIQALQYEVGAIAALPDALKAFKNGLKGSKTLGKMDELNVSQFKPKRLGAYNLPSNAMEAADQFFSVLIRGGETARGAGETGQNTAQYYLFRQQLKPEQQGYVLNKIDDVTKAVFQLRKVGLGWFIPFLRTPMNVAKAWLEYSPMGITTLPGAAVKREQMAKMMLGSLATAIGGELAMQGRTTWSAPTDPTAKQLFYDSGKKPFSVKIGDKWVPLQSFGVFAWALGLPASFKYYQEENRTALTDSQIEKMTQFALSGLNFWSQQTFVSGLGSFVKLAEGDMDYSLPKNVAYTVGQLKPYESFMRYVATVVDPVFRKPQGFTQQLMADIPGVSKQLPAYTNSTGEESTRNISNYIAPYAMGVDNPQFESLYNKRIDYMQNNALINKTKKEVEQGQGAKQVGNTLVYFDPETGAAKTIDLGKTVELPKLTGNTELDKKLISKYKSQVTTRTNDIAKLYELGKLSASEAEAELAKLKNEVDSITGAKLAKNKAVIKSIASKLATQLKALQKSGQMPKETKTAKTKLKLAKSSIPKLTVPKLSASTTKEKPVKVEKAPMSQAKKIKLSRGTGSLKGKTLKLSQSSYKGGRG